MVEKATHNISTILFLFFFYFFFLLLFFFYVEKTKYFYSSCFCYSMQLSKRVLYHKKRNKHIHTCVCRVTLYAVIKAVRAAVLLGSIERAFKGKKNLRIEKLGHENLCLYPQIPFETPWLLLHGPPVSAKVQNPSLRALLDFASTSSSQSSLRQEQMTDLRVEGSTLQSSAKQRIRWPSFVDLSNTRGDWKTTHLNSKRVCRGSFKISPYRRNYSFIRSLYT